MFDTPVELRQVVLHKGMCVGCKWLLWRLFWGGGSFALVVLCFLGGGPSSSEISSMESGHCMMVGYRAQ